MSWLIDTLSRAPSLESSLLFRLPDFLYEGVQDRAFYRPSTIEILNSLAKTDFFIHPSTGEIMSTSDVNKLVSSRVKTSLHEMATEKQMLERFKPELKTGLLPMNTMGWARFLSMV